MKYFTKYFHIGNQINSRSEQLNNYLKKKNKIRVKISSSKKEIQVRYKCILLPTRGVRVLFLRENGSKSIENFILKFGLPATRAFRFMRVIWFRVDFLSGWDSHKKIYIYVYNFYRSWIVACIEFSCARELPLQRCLNF